MRQAIRNQILFVLADDNEGMNAALDSDLDEDNKRMNRELIAEHEALAAKIERGEALTQLDLQLIRDANEIHLNDSCNLAGQHRQAVMLDRWIDGQKVKMSPEVANDGN